MAYDYDDDDDDDDDDDCTLNIVSSAPSDCSVLISTAEFLSVDLYFYFLSA